MEIFGEILKFTLPAAIICLTVYFVVKNFLQNEQNKRVMENKRDNRDLITPVRLHAYERAALFLERIMPETIIHRVHQNGMSASLLHEKLLRTIRAEFEHNLSQQVYMSDEAWTRMKNAKEELVKLINLCAVRAGNSASGIELGRLVLGLSMKMNEQPVQAALDFIKKELRKSF